MSLSVTIATRNEENNIGACLQSVKWADEIVIVDDLSSDTTVAIAEKYTSKIFIRDSKKDFHQNKNLAIEKASGDWILSLDADEVVPQELAIEIQEAISNDTMLGYYLNRKNFFLGKWIKGAGWYPDYIIRLFRKGVTQWPLDVHDTPHIQNRERVGYLESPFLHFSYITFDQYVAKFNLYTSCLAREEEARGTQITRTAFPVCFVLKPILVFLKKFIWWRGFQDGFRGLFISLSSASVIFVTYAKLWEKQHAVDGT